MDETDDKSGAADHPPSQPGRFGRPGAKKTLSLPAALIGCVGIVWALMHGLSGHLADFEGSPSSPSAATGQHTAATEASTRPATQHTNPKGYGQDPTKVSSSGTCALNSLPREAEEVAEEIMSGGPFAHPDHDGGYFGNHEGRLPQEKRGYYREYTVDTPGSSSRGERRIITGGGTKKDPDVWYYTDDHYESFCTIPDAEEPR